MIEFTDCCRRHKKTCYNNSKSKGARVWFLYVIPNAALAGKPNNTYRSITSNTQNAILKQITPLLTSCAPGRKTATCRWKSFLIPAACNIKHWAWRISCRSWTKKNSCSCWLLTECWSNARFCWRTVTYWSVLKKRNGQKSCCKSYTFHRLKRPDRRI